MKEVVSIVFVAKLVFLFELWFEEEDDFGEEMGLLFHLRIGEEDDLLEGSFSKEGLFGLS